MAGMRPKALSCYSLSTG